MSPVPCTHEANGQISPSFGRGQNARYGATAGSTVTVVVVEQSGALHRFPARAAGEGTVFTDVLVSDCRSPS